MIRTFSVTFDCHDPARVAAFWAAALGYRVEEGPAVDAQGTAPWASIADPDGSRPPVFYQRVPEAKVAKNRVHLDVEVGGEGPLEDRRRRIEAERDRLVALGATDRRGAHDEPPSFWIRMNDPEDNEFCLV